MCIDKRFISGCVCAFGAGVLLSFFLPVSFMIIVEGVLIVGAGILAFCR